MIPDDYPSTASYTCPHAPTVNCGSSTFLSSTTSSEVSSTAEASSVMRRAMR